ncbi:MAG: nucleotidyl transferase AbiEii/AbiGii toxin family protein [Nanoarchaeota archaeon]|nr:nucleotidyl transferase AbiEii/AbiGii toxin family protein [Nanoarchaeota archaeon]
MEIVNMISREELIEYSNKKGIKNLGFAEIDYLQNILLFIIYQKFGNEIVFKGGTALYKCFGLDRFSEDLDFNITKEINFKKIEDGLKDFKIEYEKEEKEFERSKKIKFKIKGPLYNGSKNSLCRLELDFSLREPIEMKPQIKKIGRFLEEIPSFDVFVMNPSEIFAEKVRAIFTRNKSRDVYDLHFLIKLELLAEKELINKKLKYYSMEYKKEIFLKKIKEKKKIWKTEMERLIEKLPLFEEVFESIKKTISVLD